MAHALPLSQGMSATHIARFRQVVVLGAALAAFGCDSSEEPDGALPVCDEGGKCDDTGTSGDPFKQLGDITEKEWDFIVVGSGAGGGPLAANLARQGHSVLLLEAGKETGGKTEMKVPAFHGFATEAPDLAWWYFVEHYGDGARAAGDTKRTAEGIQYPRGGTLGGSTAVNALITVLPKNSDWDNLATTLQDSSWAHDQMNGYYDRVSKWLGVERPDVNADVLLDGSISSILTGAFKEAAERGLGPDVSDNPLGNVVVMWRFLTRDINKMLLAGQAEGVFQFPLATREHKRNGTREYLIATARDARRFPLRIKTQALVTKVLFADDKDENGNWRATGVEFMDGAGLYQADLAGAATSQPQTYTVRAKREVILAAGAFNTPQLLMLSGFGDEAHLRDKGIEPRKHLPGVGKNLQDRYEVGVVTELSDDFHALRNCKFRGDDSDKCFRQWTDGRGVYTSNGAVVNVLMRSGVRAEADLHMFAVPGVFKGYYPGYSTDANKDKRHVTWLVLKGHTDNHGGEVLLRSSNPRERPYINFHYFEEGNRNGDADLRAVVEGVQFAREAADRADKADLFTRYTEVWPGRNADVASWIKKEAWGHHASCSAKMGRDDDPMAVLDSRFRVRGASGLRVVDASAFPDIPGTFLVLPTYMLSEKATDTILQDMGESRKEQNFPR